MSKLRASIASQIQEAKTPAETLRQTLTRLEGYVGQLGRGDQEEATELLHLLDQANALIEDITQQGGDLAPERSRFDTVKRQFNSKLAAFLKQIGGPDTMIRLRAEESPSKDRVWWFADQQLQTQRQAQQRKILRTTGIISGVVAVLWVLYMVFLAPDEATRMRYRYQQDAEQALEQGNLDQALEQLEKAQSYAPDDAELMVLQGVVLELNQESQAAQRAYEEALTAYDDEEAFYSSRIQIYMTANQIDLALADADRMIDLNPESAIGYFQRGNAHASMGDTAAAIADMETASDLAEAAGQAELQGMARVQLGNLMMINSAPQLDDATPEP